MPTIIDHTTHPHIIHDIMFGTRSAMLAFRGSSREMRDVVDRRIFHTATLTPSGNPAYFFLCERNSRSLLPWIPVHALRPGSVWPSSQLRFVRVLTVVPARFLSRAAFGFPSVRQLFNALDAMGQLEEVRWPPPPARTPQGHVAFGDNLDNLRPDLPLARRTPFNSPSSRTSSRPSLCLLASPASS